MNLKDWELQDYANPNQRYRVLDDFFAEPGQRVVFANDQAGNYTENYGYAYDFNLRDNTGQGALVLRLRNDSGNDNVVLLKNPAGDVVDFASWGNNSHGGYVWNKNQGSNTGAAMRRIRVDCNPDCSKPDDWVIGPRGPYAWDFYYDANGNVVLDKDLGWSMNYPAGLPFEYDERNLPVRIGNTHYRYNSAGQRYAKIHNGQLTDFYVMDGNRIMAVLTGVAQAKHFNLYGNGTIGRYEPAGGGQKYFYVTDHLGSTRAVVNQAGEIIEAHDYYPFGLLMWDRSYVSGSGTKEGFTGKERDGEPGFDYFGARYYNPALGRWMSVDPLADTYPGWSGYNYVLNNPLRLIDPDGRAAVNFDQIVADCGENYCYYGPEDIRNYEIEDENTRRDEDDSGGFSWRDVGSTALGFVPGVGTGQSVVELATGEDYVSGRPANRWWAGAGVVAGLFGGKGILKIGEGVVSRLSRALRNKMDRIRNATAAGGMRGISGTVSPDEAAQLGQRFLGPGARPTSNPNIFESADGLRQFRIGPAGRTAIEDGLTQTGVQARFSSRATNTGPWNTVVHLDVQP